MIKEKVYKCPYKCPKCEKFYYSQWMLAKHIKNKHENKKINRK